MEATLHRDRPSTAGNALTKGRLLPRDRASRLVQAIAATQLHHSDLNRRAPGHTTSQLNRTGLRLSPLPLPSSTTPKGDGEGKKGKGKGCSGKAAGNPLLLL
eukprot:12115567-Karenia_brevis.AAC.1